jgi:hypothetical protein
MDYELALKLKNAGFPQEGEKWLTPEGYSVCNCSVCQNEGQDPKRSEDIVEPTLEELIEASGPDFVNLIRWESDFWTAANCERRTPMQERGQMIEGEGTTAQEAVARLWLAINSK